MAAAALAGVFGDMDDATAAVIFQLQFEDSERLLRDRRDETESDQDERFALQLAREESQRVQSVLQDRQVAELVSRGIDPNEAGHGLAVPNGTAEEIAENIEGEGAVGIVPPTAG
jgi:hypothetical protein